MVTSNTRDDTGPTTFDFDAFYRQHWARALRYAVTRVDRRDIAEELVQQSFVAVWQAQLRIDSASAYLYRAISHACSSELRHRRVERAHLHEQQDVQTTQPGADEPLLRKETQAVIVDAITKLPAKQRDVLLLRYASELSENEIAEALGIRPGTVKTHASRGLANLARRLGQDPR